MKSIYFLRQARTMAASVLVSMMAMASAATLVIDEQLPAGEYILTPVVPPSVDSDADGVPDDVDDCPDEYGTEPDGCPPPPVDTDGDGLPDDVDACPTEPAQTDDGCPLPPPDADGDGVPDDTDQCADTPAGDTVDSVGCTVTPPDPGDLAATPIGQLAATLEPGETALLPDSSPGSLRAGYREDGSPAPAIDEWTSSAYWHPDTLRTFFMGLRISNRFISFDAVTGEWTEFPLGDEVPNAPPRFQATGHMYERIALDAGRGHFYHISHDWIHQYDIVADAWVKYPKSGLDGHVIEWNDSLDMLVNLSGGNLLGMRTDGTVVSLGTSPVDGYHSSARYNKTRGDMLMIGGNNSLRTVALMLPDGTIEQRADAPFDFGISVDDLTYDPVTGNYLVTDRVATANANLWEYSPDLDEWRHVQWLNGYPLQTYMQQVPIVIDELGVIAWQLPNGFKLYRHKSAFDPAEIPDTTVPAAPPVVDTDPKEPPVVVDPIPGASDNLLVDQAATMQPGEWRNISDLTTWPGKQVGVPFGTFANVDRPDPADSYPITGMGWTQTLVYDKGSIMMMLMRSTDRDSALIGMKPNGEFWRVNNPDGAGPARRPYNRIATDGENFVFFTPSQDFTVPSLVCTPLYNPGVFEGCAPNLMDSQVEAMSALAYVPEWGRFYTLTPGGKVYTWANGEESWTRLGKTGSSGYAGVVLWNSVKKELIAGGGQTFGEAENLGAKFARITSPMGELEQLPDMQLPDGAPLYYTSAQNKIIVDPRDGAYLYINRDKNIYRNDEAGGQYELIGSVGADIGYPFGAYELYAPYALIPGTDVVVFLSHVRGVVLHRLG